MTAILLEEGVRRAELRRQLLAARRALGKAEWQRRNAALCAALAAWWEGWRKERAASEAPWVGLYWPMKGEPDVRPLFAVWPRRALPAAVAPHTPLQFRPWHDSSAMTEDCYGIPTPTTAETVRPDLLIIPLLGFTAEGFRLGYGGGFYDRTLALWRREGWRGVTVGVGFADSEVADLTPQPHDVPLDLLVTEVGVRAVRG